MSRLADFRRACGVALGDLVAPARVPGYAMCSRAEQLRLDARALSCLLRSPFGWRIFYLWVIWLLVGHLLVWHFDWRGLDATAPEFSGLTWMLPALAAGRRRALRQLLGQHWTGL